MYPKNDNQFEEVTVKEVNGNQITRSDGWCFWVPEDSSIRPEVGMTARFYGLGIGATVRGLFLNGKKVFYRTETEDKEKHEIDMYGVDAADWLKRWDEGKTVWTIEMGGLGPGYEQCIHIVCAEVLRWLLANNPKMDNEACKTWREGMEAAVHEVPAVKSLGLSGAQWGAAVSLAAQFYNKGPREIMKDEAVKDRHIQVERTFPSMVAAN